MDPPLDCAEQPEKEVEVTVTGVVVKMPPPDVRAVPPAKDESATTRPAAAKTVAPYAAVEPVKVLLVIEAFAEAYRAPPEPDVPLPADEL